MVDDKAYLKLRELYDFERALIGNDTKKTIAGVDEAGRGPLAGPVVAAAVILKSEKNLEGVNDSKKLSSIQRRKLFDYIIQDQDILVGVGTVNSDTIDEINILKATHLAMRQAIEALPYFPDYLLIDGLYLPFEKKDLNKLSDTLDASWKVVAFAKKHIPQKRIIKGDSKALSIAAASIVAKVTRDTIMEEYDKEYPHFEFAKHKGYGTKNHLLKLKQYGPLPIHRKTFAPIREATTQLELGL